MKVVFFHRHRLAGNFSIEDLFAQIKSALPADIIGVTRVLRFKSNGVFKRLFISIEAALNQQDINHITGDVHFIALLLKKRKTVLTIHDLGLVNHPSIFVRSIFKWFWIKLPVAKSAIVTVVSETTKRELLKHIDENQASKIRVIYNPIKNIFKSLPTVFNEQEPVILQIGTKYNKNINRVVQALCGIKCRMEIVGKLSSEMVRVLEENAIMYSNYVGLSDEELLNRYSNSDVVSFVSTFEGFGLPIIEGNAIGRVVVTSNISSMPEVAGNAAHFVDPFDVNSIREGFLKVIGDQAYREQLILNGYENQKRFSLQRITDQYVSIYYSLRNH